jgi:hypothetical protein
MPDPMMAMFRPVFGAELMNFLPATNVTAQPTADRLPGIVS